MGLHERVNKKAVDKSIDTLLKNGWTMKQTITISYDTVGKGTKKRIRNFQALYENDRELHSPVKP